ncbi:DUF4381 family protein [Pseudaeromonas paramecii]|uniref:DUF4381 domain-containing protein n=1 Tax=Pseudaeromonas paramecii TaxID=2138166 RepID=A0ABP8QIZ5_9GAMM
MTPMPPDWPLLKEMVDVAPLPAVSWWPHTLGWQLLGTLGLLGLLALAIQALRRHRFYRYRRQALAQLARLEPKQANFASQLFLLLKHTASLVQPSLAPRLDEGLLTDLDTLAGQQGQFDSPLGRQWLRSLIDPGCTLSHAQCLLLQGLTQLWLQQHRHPQAPRLLPGGRR